MNGLQILVLGIGDAFSARAYSSSFVLLAEGHALLIDCPHPIRKMLHEACRQSGVWPIDLGDLDACVVTHLHADHASGLEGLGFFSHFAVGRPARLAIHPVVAEDLWDGHLRAGMHRLLGKPGGVDCALEDFFELRHLDEGAPLQIGPFTIRCRPTEHHIPTYALRIDAGGRSVGYSADTTFDPALVDWLLEADVVVHETNLGMHTPYSSLEALPEAARQRMRLIAFPDGFDDERRAIACLRQGELLSV